MSFNPANFYAVLAQPWWSKAKPSHNYPGKLSYCTESRSYY
jgi:hypothetical protein